MSVKVERFSSPGKGNGLRAVSGVPAGGRVWSAAPLAACVSNTLTGEVCSGCFTRRASLRRCSQCRTAPAGVGSVHKRECVCLRDLLPRAPTDSVRLAARILFNPHGTSEELYTLEEHERGLSQLADMLQIYLQPEVPDLMEEMTSLPPSCQDPLSLLAKVACNCFTISDEELKEVGVGLYPSLSLLNHDCRPNCVVVFEGSRLVLRAVKDVCPGEELLISYIDTVSVTADRQRQLSDQYHFTCNCQCCGTQAMDGAMLCGEESCWRPLEQAHPRLEGLQADSRILPSGSLLSAAECAVPDDNVHKLRVADLALDACVNLGVWGRALTYGLKTLPAYRRYYPDPHPAHGLQLMRVGKLHHYLGNTEEALDLLRQGYEILRITHGEENPLTRRLSLKLEQCRAEIRPS
uniref:SET domain-containing protein n=1 Tax=Gadus morhua TaxID=8049 RepID=A0A8C5AW36_GADMO